MNAAEHYTAQAALASVDGIAALLRRTNLRLDEIKVLICVLAGKTDDHDTAGVLGADTVCELLDKAADACDLVTVGSVFDADLDCELRNDDRRSGL